MLPGLDGWQIMEVLRKKHDVPVLFLTARDQLQDRIRGLELGADDYLVKPFSFTGCCCVSVPCCAAAWSARQSRCNWPTCN